jgi:hypothetical protein
MDDTELSTAEQVFDVLGGLDAVADLTGSKPKAVWNWKKYNSFPPRTYVAITQELKKRGKRAPASLWKMAERGNSKTRQ